MTSRLWLCLWLTIVISEYTAATGDSCIGLVNQCPASAGLEPGPERELALIECIQAQDKEAAVPEQCHHRLWTWAITLADSADRQPLLDLLRPHCGDEPARLQTSGLCTQSSSLLSCLVDRRNELVDQTCRQFVRRLEAVAFGDDKLVSNFLKHCQHDIEVNSCGRIGRAGGGSRGETLSCLQTKVQVLGPECRGEVLRVSEAQADDIRLDRQVFLHCATDRLRFCPDVTTGSGAVYKCLMLHKADRGYYRPSIRFDNSERNHYSYSIAFHHYY